MHVDLGSSESIRDPAGYFRAARERAGAVQWSDVHRAGSCSRTPRPRRPFATSTTLSADRTEVFARAAAKHSPAFGIVAELLSGWMNFRDDPAHQRLREPVRAAFTPRAVGALEKDVRETVERTIAAFDADTVDLYEAFARPIPALVIAAMLGADPEDRARFQDWSDELGAIVFSLAPGARRRGADRARDAVVRRVLHAADRARARAPVGEPALGPRAQRRGRAHHDRARGRVHPAALRRARDDHEPDRQRARRSCSSGRSSRRSCARSRSSGTPRSTSSCAWSAPRARWRARSRSRTRAAASELAPGDTVFLSIAAANHDESVFAAPAELDLGARPNPHLGFGWGPHFCLGANLARLEARVALRTLLERFPRLRAAAPIAPLAGGTMGFARRLLVTQLGE